MKRTLTKSGNGVKSAAAKAPKAPETKVPEAKAPEKPARKKAAAKALVVDFPAEGELVLSQDYTIRITASEEGAVELSLDGGPWLACRESVGYWWYDWKPTPGDHEAAARVKKATGRFAKSDVRRFRVELV
jgi:hypothetical protein